MDSSEITNKDGFYVTVNLTGTSPQSTNNYGAFFTAYRSCEVLQISEVHGVAGSATLDIEKLTGATAIGSGSSILRATFDLSSTANTVVRKTGIQLSDKRGLRFGDRLALKVSGTITSLKDIQVTLYLKPRGKGEYK